MTHLRLKKHKLQLKSPKRRPKRVKSRRQLRAIVVALRPVVAAAPRGVSARNRRLPISCAKARRFWCRLPKSQSPRRSEEHTSELQSRGHLVCRLLLEKKKNK